MNTAFALLLIFPLSLAFGDVAQMAADETQADVDSDTGTLIVRVLGLTSRDGNLRFTLFDSKQNFLKRPVRAEIVEISDEQDTWIIEDVPYATYALLVHHDLDASGKMERHWYGKPKEPTGASNDAPSRFGPPKFKDAKFQLESATLELTSTIK